MKGCGGASSKVSRAKIIGPFFAANVNFSGGGAY
jgi:hypothetical protein